MYVSLNTIRRFAKVPDVDPKDFALKVTMSTVEVEDVLNQAEALDGIVVGKVLETSKHPQADRLLVCRVDVKSEILQIICGGSNVAKGMTVAVAQVGSKVKWHGEGDVVTIEQAKIRGVESFGMIAAANEIGLEHLFPAKDEREILDLSPYGLRVGTPIAEALSLNDIILEIDNKSMNHRPDLWGQYGIAREVAALYDVKLKPLAPRALPGPTGQTKPLTVDVKNTEACPRYMAMVLDNIKVQPSPWWLRRDLEELGVRSVNNIVDVTNFIMLLTGQPLHAFDYARVRGAKISVDTAGQTTAFKALNDKVYELPSETLCIKDTGGIIALAGVMGGKESEVAESTTTIVLESANFLGSSIRRTSMALGIRSEASSRFEKKLDPQLVPQALSFAVELIQQLLPESIVASAVIDKNVTQPIRPVIQVHKAYLDSRLGVVLDAKEITAILKRLEFSVVYRKNEFTITVPTFRAKDVIAPEDVVEEVARLYGYDRIQPAVPRIELNKPAKNAGLRVERSLKQVIASGFGYTEVYNYSFAHPQWTERLGLARNRVAVKNALTPELGYLRTSLLPNLLATAEQNLRWQKDLNLFEIGRVFEKQPGEYTIDGTSAAMLPKQPRIAGGVTVSKQGSSPEAYLAVKGMLQQVLHVLGVEAKLRETKSTSFASACYELRVHDKTIGQFGLVKPSVLTDDFSGLTVVWWEIYFDQLIKFANFGRTYQPLPKYPTITRDLAIVVNQAVRWSEVESALLHISPLTKDMQLFDIFVSPKLGEGKKSMAFTITFAHPDKTLESSEVDAALHKMIKVLEEQLGAVVR